MKNTLKARAYEEINEIFLNPSESLTIEKLNQMKYLERIIKEALRLYPSVTMIGRIVNEDVQLCEIYNYHILSEFN